MSHISCPCMKKAILVLPLLLLLAFLLVGCGGNSATSTSANSASQTTATTTSQSGSSGSDATSVQNGDQQAQNLLRSLDKAQQNADSAANSGDQQDTSQTP